MALAFEQQPKESDKAFAAFAMYLSMGPERSTAAVAKQLAKSEQLVRRWSARWQWTDRVAAHASHLAVVEREATEALARGKAAEWLTRQQALRETEWEMHEKCIEAARKALAKFMEKDKVFATLADIARMLEIASKLGRLATGMPTDKTEITGEDGGPIKVEISAALDKIYGVEVMEAEVIETGGHLTPALSPTGGEGGKAGSENPPPPGEDRP